MTGYELVYLLGDQTSLLFTIFATYTTIIFAFVGAGYLFASKLTRGMASILVILYSSAAAFCCLIEYRLVVMLGAVFEHMRPKAAGGTSGLDWFPFWVFDDTQWSVPPLLFGAFVLAYLGGLVFFFHQRRVGLKAAA